MPRLLALLLLGWAIAFFGSFMAFYFTPAKDFGLAAGWNKVSVFMGWQAVATVLALFCLVMRWSSKDKITRRLAVIPTFALALMLVALAGLIFWANLQRTSPDPQPPVPTRPVTAPAADN